MNLKHHVIASTQRIYLYELTEKDAANFYRLNADPEVLQHTGDVAFKSVQEAEEFLLNYKPYENDGFGRWGIHDRQKDHFVGWCGLKYSEDLGEIDLGFRILKSFWNQGYATEASHLCLQLAFDIMQIPFLVGRVKVENQASIHLLEKLGFEENPNPPKTLQKGWKQYTLTKEKYTNDNA